MERILDDILTTHVGPNDTYSISENAAYVPHNPRQHTDLDPETNTVTVDIAHPHFGDIVRKLWALKRIPKPVNESGTKLHEVLYDNSKSEVRTFQRNDIYVEGERGLFATSAFSPGEPIFIEKGYKFSYGDAGFVIGAVVLLDEGFDSKLSKRKWYPQGHSSPYLCFTDAEWTQAICRGLFALYPVGVLVSGSKPPTQQGLFCHFSMVNHSCEPNACFAFDGDGDVHVYALKNIEPDEEITFRYSHIHGHLDGETYRADDDGCSAWVCECGHTMEQRSQKLLKEVLFAKGCIERYGNDLKGQ